jgi:hypothetical protein
LFLQSCCKNQQTKSTQTFQNSNEVHYLIFILSIKFIIWSLPFLYTRIASNPTPQVNNGKKSSNRWNTYYHALLLHFA